MKSFIKQCLSLLILTQWCLLSTITIPEKISQIIGTSGTTILGVRGAAIHLNSEGMIAPPTEGKFFYFDLDKDRLKGFYSVKFWKKDGTDIFNLHPTSGSFYTSLYQKECLTCKSPNPYWVGNSGIYKS